MVWREMMSLSRFGDTELTHSGSSFPIKPSASSEEDSRFNRLATIKFQFDLGMSFLTIVNLALLTLTASEKIQEIAMHFGYKINLLVVIIPIIISAIIGTWIFGFILDNGIDYFQKISSVRNKRNPELAEILENTRYIKSQMENSHDK